MRMMAGRRVLAVLAVAATAGCGGGNTLGTLESILGSVMGQPAGAGGGGTGELAVEIQGVDTQQQAIQVRTQEGQTGAVRYDQNTVVVYQQQQYPITALERGDLVVMQLQDVQGTLYTSRIDVTQSVQERTGTGTGTGELVQVAGRVSQIDHNAGRFVVQMQNGSVTVTLPYNTPQATVEYFHRLRVNDNVRLEARPVANGRVEIHRFL